MPDGFQSLGTDDWVAPRLSNLGVNDWLDAAAPAKTPPPPATAPPKAPSWFDRLTERTPTTHTETDEPNPAFSQDTLPSIPMTTDPGQQTVPGAILPAVLRGGVSGIGAAISGIGELAQAGSGPSATRVLNAFNLVDEGKARDAYQNLSDSERQQVGAYRGSRPGDQSAQRDALVQTIADYAQPNTAMKVGGAIKDVAPALFPVAPENEGFPTAVAGMVGGIAPILAAGAVAGPGGMLATLSVIATQSYDAMFKEATEKGATREEADAAAGKSMVAQTLLMTAPISRVLKVVPVPLRAGLVKTLVDLGQHGVEFGTFNALGTVANNYVAQQSFEPDRPLLQGVPQAALEGFAAGTVLRGVATGTRALTARPNVQPRPTVETITNAPDLDTAIDAANKVATAEPTVDIAAEADLGATAPAIDNTDPQQAKLTQLFNQTETGTARPMAVWNPDEPPAEGSAPTIAPDTARAIRDHYAQAGIDTVFYHDDPAIPFDGAVDPGQPDTIFLSNNPNRNIAQVAGHEFTHVLATTTLPDGTSLGDLLNQQIAANVTPAGMNHARKMFGVTAPDRAGFDSDEAHANAVQAHLINELGTDIGAEAPKFQSFLPRVIDAIQQRYGGTVAGDVMVKLMDGLRATMETIRGLYAEGGTRSQNWVTNIGEVHDTIAKMYAARIGTPVEREQAKLAAMKDKAERDRFVAEQQSPDAPPPAGASGTLPEAPAIAPKAPHSGEDALDARDMLAEKPLPKGWELGTDPKNPDAWTVYDDKNNIVGTGKTAVEAVNAGYRAVEAPGGTVLKLRRWLDELADKRDAEAAAKGAELPTVDTPEMAKVRDQLGAKAEALTATDYVTTSEGSPDLGHIDEAMAAAIGSESAPIRLTHGAEAHIGLRQSELERHGFANPADFVRGVAARFSEIWSAGGDGSLMVVERVQGTVREHAHSLYVLLKPTSDGRAYEVQSGGVFRANYPRGGERQLLWQSVGADIASTRPMDRGPLGVKDQSEPNVSGLESRRNAESGEAPVESTPAPAVERPADYGANNTFFTADAANAARERLRAKFNRLNAAFDENAPRRTEKSTDSLDDVLAGRLTPRPNRGIEDVRTRYG